MFIWLKNLFSKALRLISALLKVVFTSAFKLLMAKLKAITIETITKLASTDLSSDEKRKQAFEEIKAYAIREMISCDNSDIYLIIEVLHKALKKQGVIK